MLDQSLSLSYLFYRFLIMPQKKKSKTASKTSASDNYFSPFTNLTNSLSLQQHHQYSTTQQLFTDPLIETEKHIDLLNEIRYPVYMDPLNETTRFYDYTVYKK
jgi:hypothetical protein